jgi:predicted ester cyclase
MCRSPEGSSPWLSPWASSRCCSRTQRPTPLPELLEGVPPELLLPDQEPELPLLLPEPDWPPDKPLLSKPLPEPLVEPFRVPLDTFDELLAEDALDRSGPAPSHGVEPFKARAAAVRAAFADIEIRVEDLLVDGEAIAWRWALTGTHVGTFAGVTATGRRLILRGVNFQRLKGDRVVDHWTMVDVLSATQALRPKKAQVATNGVARMAAQSGCRLRVHEGIQNFSLAAALPPHEGEDVAVDGGGLRGGHAVQEALVGLECAVLE